MPTNTGTNQVNLNIGGADSYFGTNVLVIKDIPTASFSKTGIVNYFSLTNFTVDEHDITLFVNSQRNDFFILKTGRGVYDSDRRLTEDDLFHVKVSLNDFTNALKTRLQELDTLFDGITATNVSNWNDTYLRSAVDNLIVQAKNDVIAIILNNPDADINSIQELNNLISNNLTQLSTKLSFQDAQTLTQTQKQLLRQNAGLENIIEADPNGDVAFVFNARGGLSRLPVASSNGTVVTQTDIDFWKIVTANPQGDDEMVITEKGNLTAVYYPKFTVASYSPSVLADDQFTHTITITGTFIDTVSSAELVASQDSANTSATITSKTDTQIVVDITINSVNQNYVLALLNKNGYRVEVGTFSQPSIFNYVPKITSSKAVEQWVKPNETGNTAIIADGSFSNGTTDNGYNEHAYFGKLQAGTMIEVSFEHYFNSYGTRGFITLTPSNSVDIYQIGGFVSFDANSGVKWGYRTGNSEYAFYYNSIISTYPISKMCKYVLKIQQNSIQMSVYDASNNALIHDSTRALNSGDTIDITNGIYINFIGKWVFSLSNITAKTIN